MRAEKEARAAVLAAAQGMLEHRLTSGTSGNVSARLDSGTIVITPSGLPYQDMGPGDLVVITMAGEPVSPGGRPGPVVRVPASYRLLPGVRGNRGGPAQPSAVRQHVRGGPGAGARGDRRGRHLPRRGDPGGALRDQRLGPGRRERRDGAGRPGQRAAGQPWPGHGGGHPGPGAAPAVVSEHCAQVAWGARALGGHVPLPAATLETFGEAYRRARPGNARPRGSGSARPGPGSASDGVLDGVPAAPGWSPPGWPAPGPRRPPRPWRQPSRGPRPCPPRDLPGRSAAPCR